MKTLIMAGYLQEADAFIRRNDLNHMKCRNVRTPNDLRGIEYGSKIHLLPYHKNHPLYDEIMVMIKARRLEVIEYDNEGNGIHREKLTNDH